MKLAFSFAFLCSVATVLAQGPPYVYNVANPNPEFDENQIPYEEENNQGGFDQNQVVIGHQPDEGYDESTGDYDKVLAEKKQAEEEANTNKVHSGSVGHVDGKAQLLYRGLYKGKCDVDGFYYKSEYSFVMCSNGNPHEQKCALGSRNSGYSAYSEGAPYYLHDFCDDNMVNYGFNTGSFKHDLQPVYRPAPVYHGKSAYQPEVKKSVVVTYFERSTYRGLYKGKCVADGFYYNNEDSFVMCSNGRANVQRCAPGSKNSGYNQYSFGNVYNSRDFCDVNLVNYGYPGFHGYGVQGFYVPNPRFASKVNYG